MILGEKNLIRIGIYSHFFLNRKGSLHYVMNIFIHTFLHTYTLHKIIISNTEVSFSFSVITIQQ